MNQQFSLCIPTESNLPQLAALGRDTFLETFGHLYTAEDVTDYMTRVYSLESIAKEFANPRLKFQVIDSGNELVAYAKIGEVRVPVENKLPTDRELRQLYVRGPYQRAGLGKTLMEWALDQFRADEATNVYLSVFSENPRAIRFYQNYGFEKIGEYDFAVGNHLDREWIMRLNFQR